MSRFTEYVELFAKRGGVPLTIALLEVLLPQYLKSENVKTPVERKLIIHFFAHLCREVLWCEGCAGVLKINGLAVLNMHDCDQGMMGNPLWF